MDKREKSLLVKTTSKKVQSRHREKECALYIAVNPQLKNDRVVNYI